MQHRAAEQDVNAHVTSMRLNLLIFGALVLLTAMTVAVYQVHLGAWNLVVAVIIATVKATLVVLYFMHMKYETRFNVLVFIGSLLFGGIFLAYTLNDTAYRGRFDEYSGVRVDPDTGQKAYGSAPSLAAE